MLYDLNDVKLTGRLVRDPKESESESGKTIAYITLAVGGGEDYTNFIDITLFDNLADVVLKHKNKGDELLVEGELRSYKKDNLTLQSVIGKRIYFLRNSNVGEDIPLEIGKFV